MLYYKVEMGEGIAGPLSTVGAKTTELYSCSGITMINEKSKLGGLYHYPSGCHGLNVVQSAIIAMLNYVQPTMIYVTPAEETAPGMGSKKDDLIALATFLIKTKASGAKLEKRDAKTWANYWQGAEVQINVPLQSAEEPGRARLDTVENVFAAGPRALGNGVFYFGVNGEKNSSLLEPPPRSRSHSPSSRSPSPS
jgi:hypothetical protein